MAAFQPFFIDGSRGRLFAIHHPPTNGEQTNCVVIAPAFGEEMNKSRRQVSLLAQTLRAHGVGSLIVDLSGCGDSDGRFADATVNDWLVDLHAALDHARALGYLSISLLGVRAGALLLAPLLQRSGLPRVQRLMLWQPQTNGAMVINQFLRLRVAAGMMGGEGGISVKNLRARLAAGDSVEIAGYTLSPDFVSAYDALDLSDLRDASVAIDWLSIGAADAQPTPVVRKMIEQLSRDDRSVTIKGVSGEPFWSTAEIATAPELIKATSDVLETSR